MMYLPIVLYTAALLTASIVPDTKHATDPLQSLFALVPPTLQNFLHIPAYGLLAWLWIDLLRRRGMAHRTAMTVGVSIAVSYGIVMELVQFWVPGRFPSVMDAGFNLMGATIGGWLWRTTHPVVDEAPCATSTDPRHP